jgi:hypothetical protein
MKKDSTLYFDCIRNFPGLFLFLHYNYILTVLLTLHSYILHYIGLFICNNKILNYSSRNSPWRHVHVNCVITCNESRCRNPRQLFYFLLRSISFSVLKMDRVVSGQVETGLYRSMGFDGASRDGSIGVSWDGLERVHFGGLTATRPRPVGRTGRRVGSKGFSFFFSKFKNNPIKFK